MKRKRSWSLDIGGAIAIEAALALPIMAMTLLGTAYYVDAQTAARSAQSAAFGMGEYVSSRPSFRLSDLESASESVALLMEPYSAASTALRVTSVGPNAQGMMTVQWSVALMNKALPPLPTGSTYQFPSGSEIFAGVRGPREGAHPSIIVTEVQYRFSNPLSEVYEALNAGNILPRLMTISARTFTPSRHNGATVYTVASAAQ